MVKSFAMEAKKKMHYVFFLSFDFEIVWFDTSEKEVWTGQ